MAFFFGVAGDAACVFDGDGLLRGEAVGKEPVYKPFFGVLGDAELLQGVFAYIEVEAVLKAVVEVGAAKAVPVTEVVVCVYGLFFCSDKGICELDEFVEAWPCDGGLVVFYDEMEFAVVYGHF